MENVWKNKIRFTDQELSEYWGLSANTLQKWRSLGKGPAYLKLGGRIIYRKEDIEEYERARKFLSPKDHMISTQNLGNENEE